MWWLSGTRDICGLSPDLALFALAPTRLLIVLPALEVVMSFHRGLMVAGSLQNR